jgi:hypothetical protein
MSILKYSMDKEQFRRFIEQVAEIKEAKPKMTSTVALTQADQNDVKLPNGNWIHLDKETNPTLGFEFVKLKEQYRACELGCGKIVADQIIERKVYRHPQKHWRTKCVNCEIFVSPKGDSFIHGGNATQASFVRWFEKQSKLTNKESLVTDDDGREYTEIVTNDAVIRKYK